MIGSSDKAAISFTNKPHPGACPSPPIALTIRCLRCWAYSSWTHQSALAKPLDFQRHCRTKEKHFESQRNKNSAWPSCRCYPHINISTTRGDARVRAAELRAILTAEHHAFVARFEGLSREARCLLIRMVNRRGAIFNRSLFRYPEIGDVELAAAELVTAGYARPLCESDYASFVACLAKDVLVSRPVSGKIVLRTDSGWPPRSGRPAVVRSARRTVADLRFRTCPPAVSVSRRAAISLQNASSLA
ncbi:hypothetical protein [Bradyrhizobium sp.]|uniref:hypothetical protein n=1 Tax=Bradyrhizobium sp. TaxID=376 RepID=UPI003C3A40C1